MIYYPSSECFDETSLSEVQIFKRINNNPETFKEIVPKKQSGKADLSTIIITTLLGLTILTTTGIVFNYLHEKVVPQIYQSIIKK